MNPSLRLSDEYLFNGAFESGNLDCAIKVHSTEFDLFLRVDSNTRGHAAWYFFSIKNGRRREKVTLNICNLKRPSPLFEQGMRPYIFSRRGWEREGKEWDQGGSNCKIEEA